MRVLTIAIGRVAVLPIPKAAEAPPILSGIVKSPVSSLADPREVAITRLGVAGDEQADPTVHGGLAKAVYVYPVEHYPFWETVRTQAGHPGALAHGWLGENLTIEGLTEAAVWVGDVLRIGGVELRVESPRQPCFKFDARMRFEQASKVMVQSGFTGFYCSVIREGAIRAGDAIELVAGARAVSVGEMHRLKNRSRR